jgi:cyclase
MMNRKTFLRNLSLLSAGAVTAPTLFKKLSQDGPFFPLRDNAGYFTGRGGTIGWLAADDAIVVIDSQFDDSAQTFLGGISDFGGGPGRFLFNTHHHGDHTGGNGTFAGNNYRIIAHQHVPGLQRQAAQGNDNSISVASVTFGDDYTLDVGNERIQAKYYGNAHTGGDSVIWFQNRNMAHMGDLIFNRWYPFIDRPGGASVRGWISLLETVANEADRDTLFIFGHGNADFGVTGDRSDLLYMRDFLSKLVEHTEAGLAAGRSREEITSVQQFEEFPDHQSAGSRLSLPANLDVVYDELTADEQ